MHKYLILILMTLIGARLAKSSIKRKELLLRMRQIKKMGFGLLCLDK